MTDRRNAQRYFYLLVGLVAVLGYLLTVFLDQAYRSTKGHGQGARALAAGFYDGSAADLVRSGPGEAADLVRSGPREAARTSPFSPARAILFRDDGKLNVQLLDAAGVNPGRFDEAQGLVTEAWKRVSERMDARKQLVANSPGSSPDKRTFIIKADKQAAQEELSRLSGMLTQAFGSKASSTIMECVNQSTNFASFGANDLKMEVEPQTYRGREVKMLAWFVTDPKTGAQLGMGGSINPSDHWKFFGSLGTSTSSD